MAANAPSIDQLLPPPVVSEASAPEQTAAIPSGPIVVVEPPTGAWGLQITARRATPWLASLCAHLLLLLILALVVLPVLLGGHDYVVTMGTTSAASLESAQFETPAMVLDPVAGQSGGRWQEVVQPTEHLVDPVVKLVAQQPRLPAASDLTVAFPAHDLYHAIPGTGGVGLAGPALREAGSVEQAVDGLVGDLRARLQEGDLLTVWLLDASISLLDDRQRVAERLQQIFRELADDKSIQGHALINAACAFGKGCKQLVVPTSNSQKIVEAVRDVPIDSTGIENTLAAVEIAIDRYRSQAKGQMAIVIWTDESGDDVAELERVIALCHRRDVSVSVVGPSSVLGRQEGRHIYLHRENGQLYQLAVKKGPDAALGERLRLPFWHDTLLRPEWLLDGPPIGGVPVWLGGQQLEGLASGAGPYALVRLAQQTGGSYTIFDRPADRGPFSLQQMRDYLPDYRSARDVENDLRYYPLRSAVLAAVRVTEKIAEPSLPPTIFFAARADVFPFAPLPRYYPPAMFRRLMRDELDRQQKQCRRMISELDGALAPFSPQGMESEYDAETSRRWQAWYDLTRGRLLAASVRHEEYVALCAEIVRRDLFEPEANYAAFLPAARLRGSADVQAMAAEAGRLLTRCVERHAGTPWAVLAQRELDHPLGLDIQQRVVLPPPPAPEGVEPVPVAPQPGVKLPSL